MNKKKKVIALVVLAILAIITAVFFILNNPNKTTTYEELLSEPEKYKNTDVLFEGVITDIIGQEDTEFKFELSIEGDKERSIYCCSTDFFQEYKFYYKGQNVSVQGIAGDIVDLKNGNKPIIYFSVDDIEKIEKKYEYVEEETETEETETETEMETETETEETETTTEEENSFISSISEELDREVAEKALDILKNQIGFSNLEYIGKQEGLTNFKINADGYQIILTASDDVYRIFIPNSGYVFYEDGEVKLTFNEFKSNMISSDEQSAYYIMAKEIVSSGLKNPSSADFPSIVFHPEEIAMKKKGDIIAVQSYVDAKNSYNAKIRENWTVQFRVIDITQYQYEVIYINIGGESSGEFIDMD